jgi:hypothetical protein
MCSETSVIACELTSLNDLPEEILLKIFHILDQRTYA